MRALRNVCAVAWLVGIVPAIAAAQAPTPADLLKFRPSQPSVDYDVPADKAAIDACAVEKVLVDGKRVIGFALRDAQGKLLRRFVDTRGKRDLDQWSYYKDGFEVYREADLDDDLRVDESRWLNAGGSRIAQVKGGKVVAWKRLSAEEASKVLVQALVSNPVDLALLETVLAKPDELAALGVPKAEVDRVSASAAQRAEKVRALLNGLVGWNKQTEWLRFDGTMPHVIPADPANGIKDDLTLYENAFVLAGPANGQGNPTQIAYLQSLEVVKIGETWKFADLPRAVNPANPGGGGEVAVNEGIRSAIFAGAGPGKAENGELEKIVAELNAYDAKAPAGVAEGDKKAIAEFHLGRFKILRRAVAAAKTPEEKLTYNKQGADSLAAAYQTGLYPAGAKGLDALITQGGEIAPYAAFRKILADFSIEADQPGVNILAVHKVLIADLDKFVKAYPKSAEAPDALLQLAQVNEFNAAEDDARKYYAQLAQDFPATDPGKKAAGALKRLDLVGKPLALKGTTADGTIVDSAKAQGKTLLVVFWTIASDQNRHELPELAKLYQKNHAKGFEIIGVNLDGAQEKDSVAEFIKRNDLTFPQVLEPEGMDSPLGNEFGIISLPTMILVDPDGKVVNRSIRTAAEVERQLEKAVAERPAGLTGRE